MSINQKNFFRVLIIFLTTSTFVSISNASNGSGPTVKLIKSKPGKSLIVYPKGTLLKPGYYQLTEVRNATAADLGPLEQKDHFISVALDATLMKQKTTVSGSNATPVEADVRTWNSSFVYGWNKVSWEWGAFVSYSFNTTGEFDVKTLVAGLLVDKNFNPNNLEADYVFGARLQAGVGQEDSSANSKEAQVTLIQPALYLKWFGLNPNLGLTGDLGYQVRESKLEQTSTQSQGIVVRLGIANYF